MPGENFNRTEGHGGNFSFSLLWPQLPRVPFQGQPGVQVVVSLEATV